jgi:putative ABC transport system permease protein
MSESSDIAFGLFGSEVPIVSEYESIPSISEFSAISGEFKSFEGLATWTPVVSAAARMRVGGVSFNVPVFGVDPATYFDVCSDVGIERGDTGDLAAGGVFINSVLASNLEGKLGRMLELGETITFSMYSNGSFKVRTGNLAGVHSYPGRTEVIDRLVLADPTIVRGLAGYTMGFVSSSSPVPESGPPGDIDDLFDIAADVVNSDENGLSLGSLEDTLADTADRDLMVSPDAAAWSFALFSAADGQAARLESSLRAIISAKGWNTRILDWRGAAGISAQVLFAVQGAFYIGMGFIALGAVLVIMNALVISVLERTSEIGTMRGLGAGIQFIRRLFIAESMLLTLVSSVLGIIIGSVLSIYAAHVGIRISNPLLVSLFGGELIRPVVTLQSVGLHLGMAAIVGSIAWIYPVSLAMRVQPVNAMSGS